MQLKQNDELILKIEKLSNLGFGIARYENLVIFIKGACPQDIIKTMISKVNKTYAFGDILEFITPSPHRVLPFCNMQKICGACQIQFIDYEYQLTLKKEIIKDAMRSIACSDFEIKNVIPSPRQTECRRKSQYSVCQVKKTGNFKIGYYQDKSHDVVNVKHCPIQPVICDKVIDYIRGNANRFGLTGYNELDHTGDLRHIVIRSSASNGNLLVVFVINNNFVSKNLKKLAEDVFKAFPEIIGVSVNFNDLRTNVMLTGRTECVYGSDVLNEKVCGVDFLIGANTFFQVNIESAANIFGFIKDHIKKTFQNPTVLDAYAGITTFGFILADICDLVVSVEENVESVRLASLVRKMNNISNVELHCGDAGEFFAKENRKFDVVILDPPRKGCSVESLDNAVKLAKSQIIYVSCNPATLARDLKYLIEKGAKVRFIQPFDMFCHTYHVESVAIIEV